MFYCMYNGHADITAMISENGETAEKYYYDEWGKETETSKYGDMTGDGKVTESDYSLRAENGALRRYDLVVEKPDGTISGIEVKSGTAVRTA